MFKPVEHRATGGTEMTIGISGASGQLGRGVADKLLEQVDPSELVLVTRDPSGLDAYAQRGVSTRRGDFDDPASLREAYAGIDRLLLISGADIGRRIEQHSGAIDVAKEAGVDHIAYTSIVNPTEANAAAAAVEHRGTEDALRASGLAWTFLRNGIYSDLTAGALPQSIAAGQHVFNSGDGAVSYVTRDDCAAAAAAVLGSDGHENKAYDITGSEALSGFDLAALASEVSGKEVAPVSVDDETFVGILVEHAGMPEFVAQFLASFGRAAREGQLGVVSDDFQKLTGRSPAAFRTLL
jgi:NAD(P)H dehydrogenase (quinone)